MIRRARPTRLRCAALLGAALLLGGCGSKSVTDPDPTVADADIVSREIPPLRAAEVEIYLRDSTLTHEGETRTWNVYLASDGSMSGLSVVKDGERAGGQERSRGQWEVTGDGQFCRQWENDWGGGDTGCAEVYKYGNTYLFRSLSPVAGIEVLRTRRPGNPLGL